MKTNVFKALSAAAFICATGASAQDTVSVRFKVNVDAVVTAVQGEDTASMAVTADETKAMRLPPEVKGTSTVQKSVAQGMLNAPKVTGSRGNIKLRLPAQSYQKAEAALYTVNGKRILRGKADASKASNAISRKNVAAGVYMLSVKGIDGGAFTSRITHGGGNMNINVAYGAGSESRSPARQLGKKAADGEWETEWEITVSAIAKEEYYDSTYTINILDLLGYDVIPVQNITLKKIPPPPPPPPVITPFTDERDGKTYNKVTIGGQTWMAQNLNYRGDDEDNPLGLCYNNRADSCAKYGRLYEWSTAMNGASSSSSNPSGVRGVCPVGWHLPSDAEWTTLTDFVGGEDIAGTKLKSTSGWYNNGNGTDQYGFSALPGGGGYGYSEDGNFGDAGYDGLWWSATKGNASYAWDRRMYYYGEYVGRENYNTPTLCSVRCLQD